MDPVSCLYNFLSIGILCYFVIICFLIKKCCMNCGTKCADADLCKCYQKIYEGEITPSNHVIVCDGNDKLPISYLLSQQQGNEGEYVIGDSGILYRNEACKECCAGDDISRSSCNSHEDVFVIRASIREKEATTPFSPSALGLGEGSIKRTSSGRSVPVGLSRGQKNPSEGVPNAFKEGVISGVITHGDDPLLGGSSQKPATKRSSQVVEFQSDTSEHIFTVEGSVSSSEISHNIAESNTSCGSQGSRGSRGSCGSRTSNKSDLEGSKKSSKSNPVLSSVTRGASPIPGDGPLAKTGTVAKSRTGSHGNISGGSFSSLEKPYLSSRSIKKSGSSPSQAASMKVDDVQGGGAQVAGVSGANYSPAGSFASSRRALGATLPRDGSPSSSTKGILKSQSATKEIDSRGYAGKVGSAGNDTGKSSAQGATKHSKSDTDISPCGTAADGDGGVGFAKSVLCGSPGSPQAHKGGSRSPADSSPISSRGGSPTSNRGMTSYRNATSDKNKNLGTGSISGGSSYGNLKKDLVSPVMSQNSQSETISSFSPGIMSPESSPSSPDQKSDFRSGYDETFSNASGMGQRNRKPVEKSPSPILKNSFEYSPSTGKESIFSPRVSIKEDLDIISPEGIKSAPTFGKDEYDSYSTSLGGTIEKTGAKSSTSEKEECEPCRLQPDAELTSGTVESASFSSKRRNDVFSDEYKDGTSNKRKADKISADYKDLSDDTSRGAKSPRLSHHCSSGTCSSKAASVKSCSKCSKGNKSVPSSSSIPSKSEISSIPTTNLSSTKWSSKASSEIQISSITSSTTKTKPSGTNTFGDVTLKSSKSVDFAKQSLPNSSKNYKTASVTTADIDDFRTVSPDHSRCENLGSTLARSSCEEIRKIREEATCEAIKDPSNAVACNTDSTDPTAECPAIRELLDKSKSPLLLEFINTVDSLGGRQSGGTSAVISGSTVNSQDVAGSRFSPIAGTSTTVDAAVIHEISTKVQSCLQHARSIAAKIGNDAEYRKTMRVQAKNLGPTSRDQAQSVKVNSNMMLNTRGIAINEYNKVNKPFGRDPGIQVRMVNANGNVQQFKKPYKDLMTKDPNGAINIRIRSPCRSTPGKLLCVSTPNHPCCSDSVTHNTTSSTLTQSLPSSQEPRKHGKKDRDADDETSDTQPSFSSQQPRKHGNRDRDADNETYDTQPSFSSQEPRKHRKKDRDEDDEISDTQPSLSSQEPTTVGHVPRHEKKVRDAVHKTSDEENYSGSHMGGRQPSSQDYSSLDTTTPGAVVMYKRPSKQKSEGPRSKTNKGECSPECQNCKKRTCPTSKYYRGGRRKPGKLQVYNVTTSHYSQLSQNFRSHYIKGLPIVDPRLYDSYIYPERYRAGEYYYTKRREMIQKLKEKCPWMHQ